MTIRIIAIAGASGSGKSSLADALYDSLKSRIPLCIISEDSYYKDQSDLTLKQRVGNNYDHPSSLEHELLLSHLLKLRNGLSVNVPVYDYAKHNRSEKTKRVDANPLVIVEGVLLLSNALLRDQFDLSVYINTPLKVCLDRRLARDVEERGRSEESVRARFVETVIPMFHQYVAPSKQFADQQIDGSKNPDAMLDEMIDYVSYVVNETAQTRDDF